MESAGVVGGRAWCARDWCWCKCVQLRFAGRAGLDAEPAEGPQRQPRLNTAACRNTAIDLALAGYTPARAQTFQDALLERVRALPGVSQPPSQE